jgi:adenine-specific DNA-methyltransferase
MRHGLADWGYRVSTGPLVWNRHKPQFSGRAEAGCVPVIWAEAIKPDGTFSWRAERRNHSPFFRLQEGDEWLTVRQSCVLLQRTTAKEQPRRLIAAILPEALLRQHGAVVVENHLNMIRPSTPMPRVAPEVLAAFLNSAAADAAFRCVSGSVAVSAYELEALPLPAPGDLLLLAEAVANGAERLAVEAICADLYGIAAFS